jgi:hypothetical protein
MCVVLCVMCVRKVCKKPSKPSNWGIVMSFSVDGEVVSDSSDVSGSNSVVKRRGGRPSGVKDTKPRVRRTKAEILASRAAAGADASGGASVGAELSRDASLSSDVGASILAPVVSPSAPSSFAEVSGPTIAELAARDAEDRLARELAFRGRQSGRDAIDSVTRNGIDTVPEVDKLVNKVPVVVDGSLSSHGPVRLSRQGFLWNRGLQ